MTTKIVEAALSDGTLVRHKVSGYLGRIDGVTAILSCFTSHGVPVQMTTSKESFQYRVIVKGEKMRRVAPARDLEILGAGAGIDVTCFGCQATFRGSASVFDKPGGLCECGGWICPECLVCQLPREGSIEDSIAACPAQRKRLVKKVAVGRKRGKQAQSPTTPGPRFRN